MVLSAITHGQSCTVKSVKGETKAGDNTEFLIEARDRFGNLREGSQDKNYPQTQEGHKFSVVLVTNTKLFAEVELKYWNRFTGKQAPKNADCSFEPPNFNTPNGDMMCDQGAGIYLARYKPTVAGEYWIMLKYNDVEFDISPKKTKVDPASLNINGHKNSIAYGDGLYPGVSRKAAKFVIQARDRFNNNATSGGEVFTVSISGKEYIYDCSDEASQQFTRPCTQIVDEKSGFYSVTWYPEVVGAYKIRVRLQISATVQNDIKGSMDQNDCHVDPDTTSPATSAPCGVRVPGTKQCQSAAEVAGLRGGVAGTQIAFSIQARDGANNPQPPPGGDQFTVRLTCQGACRVSGYLQVLKPCQPKYKDNLPTFTTAQKTCTNCVCDSTAEQTGSTGKVTVGSGQYIVCYRTDVAGTYSMHVALTRLAPTIGNLASDVNISIGNATCCKLSDSNCGESFHMRISVKVSICYIEKRTLYSVT